jgi:hypothetical protein
MSTHIQMKSPKTLIQRIIDLKVLNLVAVSTKSIGIITFVFNVTDPDILLVFVLDVVLMILNLRIVCLKGERMSVVNRKVVSMDLHWV